MNDDKLDYQRGPSEKKLDRMRRRERSRVRAVIIYTIVIAVIAALAFFFLRFNPEGM